MRFLNRYRQGRFNPYGGLGDHISWLFIMRVRNVLDSIFKILFPAYKRAWLKPKNRKLIEDHYRQENQELSELIGIDLYQYHYPV